MKRARGSAGKRILAAAMLLLSVFTAGRLSAQRLEPAPLREGWATFAMKATTVNDFTGRVVVSAARFTGTDLANVTGNVEMRVADMRTGIGLRDSHLRNAMHADRFPTMTFELVGVDPQPARGDTIPLTYQGHLTIHGVTRTVRVPGWVILRQPGAEVHTSFPLDMREHQIDPPSRFLGAVRVDPVTQVTVHLVFGP